MKRVAPSSHLRSLAVAALVLGWVLSSADAKADDYADFFTQVCVGPCDQTGPKQVPEYSSVTLGCKVTAYPFPETAFEVKTILFVDGAPYKIFDLAANSPLWSTVGTGGKWGMGKIKGAALLKAEWIATHAGSHTLMCKVDAAHAFKEPDEANNTKTARFVVGPLYAKGRLGPKVAKPPAGSPLIITPTPPSKPYRGKNASGMRISPPQTPTPTPAGRRRG
jgi:hypothetical protein